MKSGYVYTTNFTDWKEGSTYTITATPKSGYHFVRWEKNGSQISTDAVTDVVIDGNATYTAYFESNSAPQYTITVQADNDDYCTVSGGGTYYAGTNVTISSVSKNPHLYIFSEFMLEGEDEDKGVPSFDITVTGNATYTAYYRLANPGTITATADHGTVTINQPSTNGGTEVTLSVTADEGYFFTGWDDDDDGVADNTNSTRTVYVDGNKEYVALFVQGVSIYTEEGTLQHNSANFTITGTDGDYTVQLNFDDALSTGLHTYNNMDNTITCSYVIDHGTKLQIKKVSVPVYYHGTNWLAANVEDVIIETTNGNVYKVTIYTNRITNGDNTYCDYGSCTWVGYNSNVVKELDLTEGPTLQSDGSYLVRFYTYIPDPSTYYEEYQGALSIYSDSPSLPTGRYPINSTQNSGTVFVGGCDDDENFYDSWIDVWYREMTGAVQTYHSTWTMRYGYVDIVNKGNGTYYFDVHAYSANGYPIRFTMGTPPVVSYNLAWNANGGDLSGSYTAAGSVTEGASITAPTVTRTGYTFNGWSPTFTGTMPAANTTYVAQWTLNTHNISWVTDGNALTGTYTNGTTAYGTTIVAPNTPTKTATAQYTYTFNGWTPAVAATMPDNDVEYTATWTETPVNYTLTWTTDGNALTGDYTHGTVAYGTTIAQPATPTKNATAEYTYTFNGWSPTPTATMPAANTEYTATWTQTPVNYTLTWTTDGDALTGEYTTGTVAYGTTIDQPNTPTKTGYTFKAWTPDVAATMPAANTEYTATWNTVTYNLTYTDLEGASNSNPETYTIETATFDLAAPGARDGYNFTGWTCGGDAITQIALGSTGDKTITANWEVALTPDIDLYDNTDGSEYAGLLSTHAGKKVNVILKDRTFASNRWHTLSLPFDFDFEDHPLDGRVYTLNDCTVDATNGMVITFLPVSEVKAGKPYLVWIDAAMSDVRFEDVTLTTFTPDTITAPSKDVKFIASIPKIVLTNKKYIFINNNRLYYPKQDGGSTMRAFRAYFEILNAHDMEYTPQRIRIMAQDNYGRTMEVMELEGDNTEETRKYIEDGILIIERGGVRYDAQGKKLD